jgi:hypothetical protein
VGLAIDQNKGAAIYCVALLFMAAFRKTIGGLNPWSMPSDGVNGMYIHLDPETKKWERRQYHKASRREAQLLINSELKDWASHNS